MLENKETELQLIDKLKGYKFNMERIQHLLNNFNSETRIKKLNDDMISVKIDNNIFKKLMSTHYDEDCYDYELAFTIGCLKGSLEIQLKQYEVLYKSTLLKLSEK